MLDTLLEIGKTLRESEDGLRHHRYIKKAPLGDEKTVVTFWEVDVNEDYSFDFSQIHRLKNETRKNELFYLNFKNGEADSSKPYVFGDVLRLHTRKEKEKRGGTIEVETSQSGNFYLGDPTKNSWSALSSFERYKDGYVGPEIESDSTDSENNSKKIKKVEPANPLLSQGILKFRACFRQQLPEIVAFLENNPLSYIHFNFGGKGWWDLADKSSIENILLENFIVPSGDGYVFQAFIYKTILSGSTGTPNFSASNDHKVRLFASEKQVLDLLYALNFAKRAAVRERDIKVIVLPRGKGLTAQQIERFFEKTGLAAEEDDEDQLNREAQANQKETIQKKEDLPTNGFDPTFGMLPPDEQSEANLLQFDFIFSRDGGTKPDIDLIEVSGIERSKLYDVARRVRAVKEEVEGERDQFFDELKARFAAKSKDKSAADEEAAKLVKTKRPPVFLTRAFLNILGDQTKPQKKYQSHLLKVLPQIYTATYFDDPVILPAFIEKIEFNIRNGEGLGFNLLKWDFFFLSRIQNSPRNLLMDIRNSRSYQVGFLLGKLARGLRSKINSFDKNYAGLISRRISNLPDVVRLHVEINQKLIMHDRAGLSFKVSPQLTEALKDFEGQYNKDQCAFGFFESYFAPYKSAQEEKEEESVPTTVFADDVAASTDAPA